MTESLPAVLEALAALLWPLIVLVLLYRFAPAVGAIIDSARSRKFTLKVGGQELTMEEVRAQQSNLIADLQTQVAELREALGTGGAAAVAPAPAPQADDSAGATVPGRPRVLWVDDQPKNNSYFVEQLREGGVEVDLARDTAEGLQSFERERHRLVVSDIGRREGASYDRDAGFDLLREIRRMAPDTPFAFFTSAAGVRHRSGEARQLGADLVTTSATQLVQFLREKLPEWRP